MSFYNNEGNIGCRKCTAKPCEFHAENTAAKQVAQLQQKKHVYGGCGYISCGDQCPCTAQENMDDGWLDVMKEWAWRHQKEPCDSAINSMLMQSRTKDGFPPLGEEQRR
jgi:hypothetical protein